MEVAHKALVVILVLILAVFLLGTVYFYLYQNGYITKGESTNLSRSTKTVPIKSGDTFQKEIEAVSNVDIDAEFKYLDQEIEKIDSSIFSQTFNQLLADITRYIKQGS